MKFDDYPGVRVRVDFLDGLKLEASTRSYYVFMIPWRVDAQDGETINADISRAVSALMPTKTVNRERLAGSDLPEQLTKAVMNSYIDTSGKMVIGLQDLSFAQPFHNGLARVDFGKAGWG